MNPSARYKGIIQQPDPLRWDDPGHIEYMAARFITRLSLTKIMLRIRAEYQDSTHFTAYYSPDRSPTNGSPEQAYNNLMMLLGANPPTLPGQGLPNEPNH